MIVKWQSGRPNTPPEKAEASMCADAITLVGDEGALNSITVRYEQGQFIVEAVNPRGRLVLMPKFRPGQVAVEVV